MENQTARLSGVHIHSAHYNLRSKSDEQLFLEKWSRPDINTILNTNWMLQDCWSDSELKSSKQPESKYRQFDPVAGSKLLSFKSNSAWFYREKKNVLFEEKLIC